jgi:hypothetical protein
VVRTIASPRLMSKLSPIANLANNQGINVNPLSQKGLLKYALNKGDGALVMADDDEDSADDNDVDASKFGSKKARAEAKRQRQL